MKQKIRKPPKGNNSKVGEIKHNWDAIQTDWEDVVLSNREISEKHKINYDYMCRRAKALGWRRGEKLSHRIEQRTQEKLAFQAVSLRGINTENGEDAAVEAVSDQMTAVISGQRLDIGSARDLCRGLLAELQLRSLTEEQRNRIVDVICSASSEMGVDRKTVIAQVKLFMASLDLPNRVKMMQSIAATLETLIRVERQAYGIDVDKDEPPYEAALSELKQLAAQIS